MAALKVRADYEALSRIAAEFRRQAMAARRMLLQLRLQKSILQNGHWVGAGADKFYTEMDSGLLPAVQRLVSALDTASVTTLRISRVMKSAETDAARLFQDGLALGEGGINIFQTPTPAGPVPIPYPNLGGSPGAAVGGAVNDAVNSAADRIEQVVSNPGQLISDLTSLVVAAKNAAGAGTVAAVRVAAGEIDSAEQALDTATRAFFSNPTRFVSAIENFVAQSVSVGAFQPAYDVLEGGLNVLENAIHSSAYVSSMSDFLLQIEEQRQVLKALRNIRAAVSQGDINQAAVEIGDGMADQAPIGIEVGPLTMFDMQTLATAQTDVFQATANILNRYDELAQEIIGNIAG